MDQEKLGGVLVRMQSPPMEMPTAVKTEILHSKLILNLLIF